MAAKKKIENETPESEVIQDEAVEVEDKVEEMVETETAPVDGAEIETESEEVTEAEVEDKVEAEVVAEPEPVIEDKAEEEIEAKSKSKTKVKVKAETEAEVEAEPVVEDKAEEKIEAKSKTKTKVKVKAKAKTEEATEAEPVVEEEAKPESQKVEDSEIEVVAESVPYISPDEPVVPVAPVAEEADGDETDSEEDEEEKIDVDRAKWYTIRTFSGQERKIMESLLATIDREGMEDRIYQVLVPTENVIEMRDGKKRHRVKVNFPGYVLIQMDLDKETQFLVEDAYGVLNFIGPRNQPQALGQSEVRRILGDAKEKAKGFGAAAPYAVGDSIKVVDGPFNDFAGYVQEINQEKQKVKVMVSIFGRATPVELDFLQVQIEK